MKELVSKFATKIYRRQWIALTIAGMFSFGWSHSLLAHDQIPGAPQTKPIVISNATVHTVSGDVIKSGVVVIKDGKIAEVGTSVTIPSEATRIDAAGGHVYPGLIDPLSNIGLSEVDSVRATVDSRETGIFNPNVRAAAAFNPDSELIPVARANGVLLGISAPNGGLISGRAALMMMDGWTWEDMTLKADVGMIVNWPSVGGGGREGRGGGGGGGGGPREGGGDELKLLNTLFDQAERYRDAISAGATPKFDARLAALGSVLDKKMPIIVAASRAAQIRSAVAFAKDRNLKLIIYGGFDAMDCQEVLLAEKVPVIVAGVYRLPSRQNAPYDDAYTLPARLHQAGIPFCIATAGRFGGSTLRNLPYHAATAAAYGLDQQEALRSITLSAAEILGVENQVGSIAPGKDATIFVADGDILETPTQVTHAFVQGRVVDLNSRHTQLYRKYSAKYDRP